MIVSGGYDIERQVSIFNIKNQKCPQLMTQFNTDTCYDYEYTFHASVIVNRFNNMNKIELLLFGGANAVFRTSFCKLTIDFDNLDIISIDQQQSQNQEKAKEKEKENEKQAPDSILGIPNPVDRQDSLNISDDIENTELEYNKIVSANDESENKDIDTTNETNINSETGSENDNDNPKWNVSGVEVDEYPSRLHDNVEIFDDALNAKQVSNYYRFGQPWYNRFDCRYFSHQLINSRYLLIIGGRYQDFFEWDSSKGILISDRIFYFDLNKNELRWKLLDYKLPKGILGHRSVILQSNDNYNKEFLHIMGGCDEWSQSFECTNVNWKFNITRNLDWNIERIVWIGFYKNGKNKNSCYLPSLPKDVVAHCILDLLRGYSIFDTLS